MPCRCQLLVLFSWRFSGCALCLWAALSRHPLAAPQIHQIAKPAAAARALERSLISPCAVGATHSRKEVRLAFAPRPPPTPSSTRTADDGPSRKDSHVYCCSCHPSCNVIPSCPPPPGAKSITMFFLCLSILRGLAGPQYLFPDAALPPSVAPPLSRTETHVRFGSKRWLALARPSHFHVQQMLRSGSDSGFPLSRLLRPKKFVSRRRLVLACPSPFPNKTFVKFGFPTACARQR